MLIWKFYYQIKHAQQALACKPTKEILLEKINDQFY